MHNPLEHLCTPNADFNGTDSFKYKAKDNHEALSNEAMVTIVVQSINDAPRCMDTTLTTNEDTTGETAPVCADGDGDALSYRISAQGTKGSASLRDNQLDYQPNPNVTGKDSFTYAASDGRLTSAAATVAVTITPVDDAPQAVDDTIRVSEDASATTLDVLGNDTDIDGGLKRIVAASDPPHGTVIVAENGLSLTYVPDPNYCYDGSSTDDFTYALAPGSSTATVLVTVTCVNDPPTAVPNSYLMSEDQTLNISAPGVLGNDSDPDADDTLTAVLVSGSSHGLLTLNRNGSFRYTPAANYNGADSFTYKVRDATGAESAPVSASLTVIAVNDAPTVTIVAGGTCNTDFSGTLNLLLSDIDSPVNSLTLTGSTDKPALLPSSGITFGGSGTSRTVMISGVAGRSGSATLTIKVSDGAANATITVTYIAGTNKQDTLIGTSGPDLLFGANANDTLTGNAGTDLLCGGKGDDTLIGGDGNDTLNAGNGNDKLTSGNGNDLLTGDAGADNFSGGPGDDTVTDFTPSQGDTQDGTVEAASASPASAPANSRGEEQANKLFLPFIVR